MPTSTNRTKKDQTVAQPIEHQMWSREGFDRRGIRREFAGFTSIDLGDKYVEQDDRSFVDPRTIDMPVGPTGMGEVGGSGVEMARIDGDRWPTHRWTQGFETLFEDSDDVSDQTNAVMELFDFFSDASFLTGLGPSGEYADGMFDWLRNAIPSTREFDCLTYADGTNADYDADGVEEQLLKLDAYKTVSGELLTNENAQWDLMVGSQEALANFNGISSGDYNKDTYWERLNAPNAKGGVRGQNLIPEDIAPTRAPDDLSVNDMTVNLVDDSVANKTSTDDAGAIGNDEVFLLPDMGAVREKFFRTYEMGTPHAFDPIPQRGGKNAYDYATRYTHRFNPEKDYSDATDAIHLTNVSALFN